MYCQRVLSLHAMGLDFPEALQQDAIAIFHSEAACGLEVCGVFVALGRGIEFPWWGIRMKEGIS